MVEPGPAPAAAVPEEAVPVEAPEAALERRCATFRAAGGGVRSGAALSPALRPPFEGAAGRATEARKPPSLGGRPPFGGPGPGRAAVGMPGPFVSGIHDDDSRRRRGVRGSYFAGNQVEASDLPFFYLIFDEYHTFAEYTDCRNSDKILH